MDVYIWHNIEDISSGKEILKELKELIKVLLSGTFRHKMQLKIYFKKLNYAHDFKKNVFIEGKRM